ncbi:MAG TPA: LuxR C-terminal-related transcriptional regulator [Dermatophilaceae bacterium]|nr:LuxR C-terminal-related transcriptional regulator [Dermatophilaceae bacterium]
MSGSSLSERDLRALLDVVAPEAVASPGLEMPDQVLLGLAELIPCKSMDFCVMDPHRAEVHAEQYLCLQATPGQAPESDEQFWQEADVLFWEGYWDCAACSRRSVGTAVTTRQDFHSEREYAKHPMADYYRRCGVWHDLVVRLPPRGRVERHLALFRVASDLPFSERDRLVLTLLQPHLIDIRDQIEADRRTVPVLTPRQLELLRRVAVGDTNRQVGRDLGLSEGTVRKHMEDIYARLEVHSRTEALTKVGYLVAS